MLKLMKTLTITIALLFMTMTGLAQADPRNGFSSKNTRGEQRGRISPGEAAARAQAREGGKILSVDPIRGGDAYRVKILNRRGQVRVITVNANR